jgi:hypothetical protein
MKKLRQPCVAFALIFVLTLPAFAGQMDTGIAPPQPPAPASATTEGEMSTAVAGDMSTTKSEEAAAGESVTEIALNLMQSVLSLF